MPADQDYEGTQEYLTVSNIVWDRVARPFPRAL